MKKLAFIFMTMAVATFTACGDKTNAVATNDSTAVDTVVVDTLVVDTLVIDSVAAQ